MIVLAGMKQQEVGENLHLGTRQTKHYNVFKTGKTIKLHLRLLCTFPISTFG